jgi:HEAT repeat protein
VELQAAVRDLKSRDAILRGRALAGLANGETDWAPNAALVRACVARLGDRERVVRRFAAEVLGRWLANGDAATRRAVRERLRGALEKRDPHLAWSAAFILARVDGPRPALAPALMRAFALDDTDARWTAAVILTRMASARPSLARRLVTLSRRGSPGERRMALFCLRDLPLREPEGLAPFIHALDDPDPLVRSAAVSALGHLGRKPRAVVDGLLRTLREDPSWLVRRMAAVTLGQVGASRRDVRHALEVALEAEDHDLRKAARHALAHLVPPSRRSRDGASTSHAPPSRPRTTRRK